MHTICTRDHSQFRKSTFQPNFWNRLGAKVFEEWKEFWETPNEEEMADCLQVLQDTAAVFGIEWQKVKAARSAKAEDKGSFSMHIEVDFHDIT